MISDDSELVTVDSGKILAGAERVYGGFRSSFLRKQESRVSCENGNPVFL
jgi:hypothetical protein